MDKKQLKKDFKKKCKEEKAMNYKHIMTGTILACIGCILVVLFLLLDQNGIVQFPMQIVGYGLGAVFAIIGMILDLTGEIEFSREFKNYLQSYNDKL